METLSVSLPLDLAQRLAKLAEQTGRTQEEALLVAVEEFVVHWETHLNDLDQLSDEEMRVVLSENAE